MPKVTLLMLINNNHELLTCIDITYSFRFSVMKNISIKMELNINREYDHEAFLGRDDVKEFEQLTPDESKQQLA